MNIPKLIKEAHDNAVERGDYDCPECKGKGIFYQENPDCPHCPAKDECSDFVKNECPISSDCLKCNGTGINPNKNIGELLMDIIGSLYRALEAHRNNRFAELQRLDHFIKNHNQMIIEDCDQWYYLTNIKDTREDKIADVFIRLFDLCGYLGIEPKFIKISRVDISNNIGERLLHICGLLCELHIDPDGSQLDYLTDTINVLYSFCETWNIPIEKHIKAKMAYNRIRPHKHGKEY